MWATKEQTKPRGLFWKFAKNSRIQLRLSFFASRKYLVSEFVNFHFYLKYSCCRSLFHLVQQQHEICYKISLLCFMYFLVCLKYNFPNAVNSKVLLLKQEYFKDLFRLKSGKKKRILRLNESYGIPVKKASSQRNNIAELK